MAFSWTCPYCNQNATITDSNISRFLNKFNNNNKYGLVGIEIESITCPNLLCKESKITARLAPLSGNYNIPTLGKTIISWNLKPNSSAKTFPDYIPKAVLDDYNEACLIRDLSPKASATLSRRCLQGMIRDYWGVSKNTLNEEIKAIKDRIDPIIWQAIDAVRKIGNIGAHMEKDINLIIDVSSEEADLLIEMIEMLLDDWYVARHDRQQKLQRIKEVAAEKAEARKG